MAEEYLQVILQHVDSSTVRCQRLFYRSQNVASRGRAQTAVRHRILQSQVWGLGNGVNRLHHRNNHQAEDRELQDLEPSALDCTFSKNTSNLQHDLPDVSDSVNRLPSEESRGILEAAEILSHMSTPESIAKAGQHLLLEKDPKLVGFMREETSRQLHDMQAPITNAQTPASDQEPEVLSICTSPSKRRKLVYLADGLGRNITRHNKSTLSEFEPKAEILIPEACEDSGLTAEQHMADLDSSKSSTLEDIDSTTAHVSTCRGISQAPPQCILEKQVAGENVEQLSEGRQMNLHLSPEQNVSRPSKGNLAGWHNDAQAISQILLSTGRTWMDSSDTEPIKNAETESVLQKPRKPKTMVSDKWLQLSLGSPQSDESPGIEPVRELEDPQSPTSDTSPAPLQPRNALVDFFNSRGSENEDPSAHAIDVHKSTSPRSTYSGREYSRPLSGILESTHLPVPSSFYLEPRSRDSSRADLNVHASRGMHPGRSPSSTHTTFGNVESQFLSPSPILQKGYAPPAFSNLSTLPHHPARVFQSVKSQQTKTTSVNALRGRQTIDAGAGRSSVSTLSGGSLPRMQSHHNPPRTPLNSADSVNIMTPTPTTIRDWKSLPSSGAASSSLLSMHPPVAQGVDHEQAWRHQIRVRNNLNLPSDFGPSSSLHMPHADPQEYLGALKRTVEGFQGPNQGLTGDSLLDLQLLQRSSMFPPVQLGSQFCPPFDSSRNISLANTLSSNGSKARGPTSSSERQRRILNPCAPRPGLWFTLQASSSSPEASPFQQIPAAYIRVLDGNMTVAAVMKYLMNKLGLSSEDEVELTCKGQLLVPSISLSQVRDGIWQSPNTNTADPRTPQLLSEGKAGKSPDGSVTLVGDVVMVLTYGRQSQGASKST